MQNGEKSFLMGEFNGTLFAFCEMVHRMHKPLAFSKPFFPEEEEELRIFAENNTAEFKLGYYLEKDLLLTKLFRSVNMQGRWVYIVYRERTALDAYFSLKDRWSVCVQESERTELSRRYAALMGYREDAADELLGAPPKGL